MDQHLDNTAKPLTLHDTVARFELTTVSDVPQLSHRCRLYLNVLELDPVMTIRV
jgi:hypothetical protein